MPAALTFETLAATYFAILGLAAATTRTRRVRHVGVATLALGSAIGVAVAARLLPSDVRLWLGHAYLAAGYWIPALLVTTGDRRVRRSMPDTHGGTRPTYPDYVRRPGAAASHDHRAADPANAFEAWLVRSDRRWQPLIARSPTWALGPLELSYLLCYVVVPAGFIVVWIGGNTSDGDRFWSAVLLAGFVCYGTLPWLISRPPRVVESVTPRGIARMNVYVLKRVSHGFNTFPSGHVAVSLAAALEVLPVSSPAGAAMAVIAAGVAAGAVAGRYHYAVDVLLGLLIGVAATALAALSP